MAQNGSKWHSFWALHKKREAGLGLRSVFVQAGDYLCRLVRIPLFCSTLWRPVGYDIGHTEPGLSGGAQSPIKEQGMKCGFKISIAICCGILQLFITGVASADNLFSDNFNRPDSQNVS